MFQSGRELVGQDELLDLFEAFINVLEKLVIASFTKNIEVPKLTIGDAADAKTKTSRLFSSRLCPYCRFVDLSLSFGDLSQFTPGAVMRVGDSSAQVFVTWTKVNTNATDDIVGSMFRPGPLTFFCRLIRPIVLL